MEAFKQYHWPGNVRELENTIENLVIFTPSGGTIMPHQLPFTSSPSAIPDNDSLIALPVGSSMDTLEREAIRKTLRMHDGNKTQTAKTLGIGIRTLYRKMEKYGFEL